MVVLDQFYQIAAKETSFISSQWKVIHVSIFVVAAVCGFTTAFTFGHALDDFNYNCILQANVIFDPNTFLDVDKSKSNETESNNTQKVRAIDLISTKWGTLGECNFVQFTPIGSLISAVLWGAFFVIMAKGGAGYTSDILARPWRIVYPCIIFSVIFCIIFLVSTIQLAYGISTFCRQFSSELNNTNCVPEIDTYTLQFQDTKGSFYQKQRVAVLCAYVGFLAWVFQLGLLICRVAWLADFQVYLVTISDKDEEHVQQVIEFQQDDGEVAATQV